jgi:ribosomal protein S18 acetylase RimI-like enzyme
MAHKGKDMAETDTQKPEPANPDDLPEILKLQKLAFLSEAEALGDHSIQPLTQTLDELRAEFEKGPILVLRERGGPAILGSVRARQEGGLVYVAKLVVHPSHQNRGLGQTLLAAVEGLFGPQAKYVLHTNAKNPKNLHLYDKMGYREFKREKMTDRLNFVFLEKRLD